ncbi:MAG: GNAT family N-acetyltransferase [Pirellulaceae bacterium]
MDTTFRRAEREDIETLVDFNCRLAHETENKSLDRELVTRGVTRAFDQGEEAIYYVAVVENQVVGSLMLTREWSDWRDGWIAWLQSVFVREDHRGNRVFTQLLDHATKQLRIDPDVRGLRLYVEVDNTRAQNVYYKTGFGNPGYQVLEQMF